MKFNITFNLLNQRGENSNLKLKVAAQSRVTN